MKERLLKYFKSDKHLWWTVTVLPGVYSILYLYTNNFTSVNSWIQLGNFLLMFILLPVVEIVLLDLAFKKWLPNHRSKLYWSYLIINFAIILSLCVFQGWRWKGLILVAIISIVSAFFTAKHYKKLVLILGLMTLFALANFTFFYVTRIVGTPEWSKTQDFEKLVFEKKPNIYLIQPDGFVAPKAAKNPEYQWSGTDFYSQLEENEIFINREYRSNYPTTLTSNSALFTGQHHYFNNGKIEGELFNARDIIVGKNAALNTLKSNGYQLNAILQHKYLLLNHPKVAYDYINVDYNDVNVTTSYISNNDYKRDLYDRMEVSSDLPQFYFVEVLSPGHISVSEWSAGTIEEEREVYLQRMDDMAIEILEMTQHISKKDPDAIIILAADHGGFVGFKSTGEAYAKPTQEIPLKQSLFSALLAVKAPTDFKSYQENIKSSVGIFSNLFHYLAARPVPLDTLDNSSYIFIKKEDVRGVYKYYNTNGEPVTEKIQL
ncbi:hypothetical protein SAMN05192588_1879 [Nonlabens sp. Hel1_33_55]|uniref:hypothetical protein n=1 Tax=Nonlabens sp. Hel1_33_55 TaxID=1336802 RepID=UPI000875C450|nr:hypothetical protein [Nonlabens sp. Hel1_33_55]SCY25139.1 hypothetical protein SAMN05192588_1879 [Nonlabens sp. Hel1_33_55]